MDKEGIVFYAYDVDVVMDTNVKIWNALGKQYSIFLWEETWRHGLLDNIIQRSMGRYSKSRIVSGTNIASKLSLVYIF